ncbi:hypothetical protein CAOG_01508 [Capsaspora owczarzaki ATCC 30864]|uniref:Uncharacterized protein n=1 Tax=Capsaspora owczarzaki (strain ATCC 30864) TaxID=595528 RepID=A0A0D2U4U4_CAPO3|nr:hypothetical protein CAOG_01508 [Capsaspora owczarzaki ATCC 30864]KJE90161.1 hypothetical protein CAOG_001508 [Capsaspora owczarzaki ATCC 30864]|eukprot:XP_004364376.2 hypothetical protein CAOG_01508 [Capsaspora owczarzaki ATCC 30864]
MDMMRRGYVLTKSLGVGHSDLNLAISDEKAVHSGLVNLAKARTAAATALVKWTTQEDNPAIRDIFARLAELDNEHNAVQKEFSDRYEDYRRCFKAVRDSEKTLDRARKHRDDCATKLQKLHRDLERYNRKGDYGKVSTVESEIIAAEQANDVAEAEFQEKYRECEIIKVAKIKEGLSNVANAYIEMAEKMVLVFSATKDLASVLPDEPAHLTTEPVYEGGEAYSEEIVQSARRALQEYQPQTPYSNSNAYANDEYEDDGT